jgi:undecaprenyl diphosphate synthase
MKQMNVPNHVAIILDGNGRWAKSKGMPREYGHTMGSKNVEKICEVAAKLGISYLTFYVFSTENWKRPPKEVGRLMTLLRNYMKTAVKRAADNNMRVRVIGDRSGLDADIRESIARVEESSKNNTGLCMTMAINYGARDEITRAVRKIAQDAADGKLDPSEITEETIESALDTAGLPDPDLMIRTSGEQRLSNYLLWQLAYTEFYFCDVHWPAFSEKDLVRAIEVYNQRDRRFGKVTEEA